MCCRNEAQASLPLTSEGYFEVHSNLDICFRPVAIPLPRYTHAAAPNVVRPRGAVAAAAEKSKDKTFVRIARVCYLFY
jgi:hypothetical protein